VILLDLDRILQRAELRDLDEFEAAVSMAESLPRGL
jgi:hypothetical protein